MEPPINTGGASHYGQPQPQGQQPYNYPPPQQPQQPPQQPQPASSSSRGSAGNPWPQEERQYHHAAGGAPIGAPTVQPQYNQPQPQYPQQQYQQYPQQQYQPQNVYAPGIVPPPSSAPAAASSEQPPGTAAAAAPLTRGVSFAGGYYTAPNASGPGSGAGTGPLVPGAPAPGSVVSATAGAGAQLLEGEWLVQLKALNAELTHEVGRKERRIQELEDKTNAGRLQTQLQAALEQLRSNQKLLDGFQQRDGREQALQRQVAELESAAAALKLQLLGAQEGYEARLRSVTAAAGERSAEVEVLEARLADEVARAQGLERELEAAAAQQRRAQEIVAAQEAELAQLRFGTGAAEAAHQRDQLRALLANKDRDLAAAERALALAMDDKRAAEKRALALEAREAGAGEQRAAAVMAQLDASLQEAAALKRELREARDAFEQLKRQNEESASEVIAVRDRLADLEAGAATGTGSAAEAARELRQTRVLVKRRDVQVAELTARVNRLSRQAQALAAENADLRGRLGLAARDAWDEEHVDLAVNAELQAARALLLRHERDIERMERERLELLSELRRGAVADAKGMFHFLGLTAEQTELVKAYASNVLHGAPDRLPDRVAGKGPGGGASALEQSELERAKQEVVLWKHSHAAALLARDALQERLERLEKGQAGKVDDLATEFRKGLEALQLQSQAQLAAIAGVAPYNSNNSSASTGTNANLLSPRKPTQPTTASSSAYAPARASSYSAHRGVSLLASPAPAPGPADGGRPPATATVSSNDPDTASSSPYADAAVATDAAMGAVSLPRFIALAPLPADASPSVLRARAVEAAGALAQREAALLHAHQLAAAQQARADASEREAAAAVAARDAALARAAAETEALTARLDDAERARDGALAAAVAAGAAAADGSVSAERAAALLPALVGAGASAEVLALARGTDPDTVLSLPAAEARAALRRLCDAALLASLNAAAAARGETRLAAAAEVAAARADAAAREALELRHARAADRAAGEALRRRAEARAQSLQRTVETWVPRAELLAATVALQDLSRRHAAAVAALGDAQTAAAGAAAARAEAGAAADALAGERERAQAAEARAGKLEAALLARGPADVAALEARAAALEVQAAGLALRAQRHQDDAARATEHLGAADAQAARLEALLRDKDAQWRAAAARAGALEAAAEGCVPREQAQRLRAELEAARGDRDALRGELAAQKDQTAALAARAVALATQPLPQAAALGPEVLRRALEANPSQVHGSGAVAEAMATPVVAELSALRSALQEAGAASDDAAAALAARHKLSAARAAAAEADQAVAAARAAGNAAEARAAAVEAALADRDDALFRAQAAHREREAALVARAARRAAEGDLSDAVAAGAGAGAGALSLRQIERMQEALAGAEAERLRLRGDAARAAAAEAAAKLDVDVAAAEAASLRELVQALTGSTTAVATDDSDIANGNGISGGASGGVAYEDALRAKAVRWAAEARAARVAALREEHRARVAEAQLRAIAAAAEETQAALARAQEELVEQDQVLRAQLRDAQAEARRAQSSGKDSQLRADMASLAAAASSKSGSSNNEQPMTRGVSLTAPNSSSANSGAAGAGGEGIEKALRQMKADMEAARRIMDEQDDTIRSLRADAAQAAREAGAGAAAAVAERELAAAGAAQQLSTAQAVIDSLTRELEGRAAAQERYREMYERARGVFESQRERDAAEIERLTEQLNADGDASLERLKGALAALQAAAPASAAADGALLPAEVEALLRERDAMVATLSDELTAVAEELQAERARGAAAQRDAAAAAAAHDAQLGAFRLELRAARQEADDRAGELAHAQQLNMKLAENVAGAGSSADAAVARAREQASEEAAARRAADQAHEEKLRQLVDELKKKVSAREAKVAQLEAAVLEMKRQVVAATEGPAAAAALAAGSAAAAPTVSEEYAASRGISLTAPPAADAAALSAARAELAAARALLSRYEERDRALGMDPPGVGPAALPSAASPLVVRTLPEGALSAAAATALRGELEAARAELAALAERCDRQKAALARLRGAAEESKRGVDAETKAREEALQKALADKAKLQQMLDRRPRAAPGTGTGSNSSADEMAQRVRELEAANKGLRAAVSQLEKAATAATTAGATGGPQSATAAAAVEALTRLQRQHEKLRSRAIEGKTELARVKAELEAETRERLRVAQDYSDTLAKLQQLQLATRAAAVLPAAAAKDGKTAAAAGKATGAASGAAAAGGMTVAAEALLRAQELEQARAHVFALEEEVALLKRAVNVDCHHALEALRRLNGTLQQRVADLQQQLALAETAASDANNANSSGGEESDRVSALSAALAKERARHDRVEQELIAERQRALALQYQAQAAVGAGSSRVEELTRLRTRVFELQQALQALDAAAAQGVDLAALLGPEAAAAVADSGAFAPDAAAVGPAARLSKQELAATVVTLGRVVERQRREVEDLRLGAQSVDKLLEAQTAAKKLRERAAAAEQERQAAEAGWKAKGDAWERDRARLNAHLREAREAGKRDADAGAVASVRAQEAEKLAAAAAARLAAAEKALEAQKREVARLSASTGAGVGAGTGSGNNGSLQTRVLELDAENARLRERLQALEPLVAGGAVSVGAGAMSEAEADALRRERDELAGENHQLRQELSAFDVTFFDEVEDLKERYTQAVAALATAQTTIDELKRALDTR